MKKLWGILVLGLLAGMMFAGLGSAYYYQYNYNDDYSRRTYSSTWEHNGQLKTTDYDRATSTFYLGDGTKVRSTTYTRTTTESPQYNYGYYGNQYSFRPDYANYYRPWYQKYWNQPNYYSGYYRY